MNKSELAESVAKNAGLTELDARKMITIIFNVISRSLKVHGQVKIMDFGTFELGDRKERNVMNPVTREIMQIKARKVPVFTASKVLKKVVL